MENMLQYVYLANRVDTAKMTSANVLPDSVQQMFVSFEDVSKKLLHLVNTFPLSVHQDTWTTHPLCSIQSDAISCCTSQLLMSLKDLNYIYRHKFKVKGRQIGDNSPDISYGWMQTCWGGGFNKAAIMRGIVRIKPGHFKDILVNKEYHTIAELKDFLELHLGKRKDAELFQEPIYARQKEQKIQQQFLYHVIGLKQKTLFSSKQMESGNSITPDTGYQRIGNRYTGSCSTCFQAIQLQMKSFWNTSWVTKSDVCEQQRSLRSTPLTNQLLCIEHEWKLKTQGAKYKERTCRSKEPNQTPTPTRLICSRY